MTLTEIKEIFNIDLKTKNRKHHAIFIRNLYINQEYNIKKRTIANIAHDLQMIRESLYNSIAKTKEYEEDENYQMIKLAFNTKDPELYHKACYILKNKNYPPVPNEFKPKRIQHKKREKMPEVRWPYLRIINALRFNNDSYLWNKLMKEFNINDYKVLECLENKFINSTMEMEQQFATDAENILKIYTIQKNVI